MLNNKGQSLVIFVIVLPILLLFISYVFDVITINYERNRLNNIAVQIKDNVNTLTDDEIVILVNKNDKEIDVDIKENEIKLSKKIKGVFNKITKQEYYNINIIIAR